MWVTRRGGGGVAQGSFHAQMLDRPLRSEVIIPGWRGILTAFKRSFSLQRGEGDRAYVRLTTLAGVLSTTQPLNLGILRVIDGQGYIHCLELGEERQLKIDHATGQEVRGRQRQGGAIGERKHTLRSIELLSKQMMVSFQRNRMQFFFKRFMVSC